MMSIQHQPTSLVPSLRIEPVEEVEYIADADLAQAAHIISGDICQSQEALLALAELISHFASRLEEFESKQSIDSLECVRLCAEIASLQQLFSTAADAAQAKIDVAEALELLLVQNQQLQQQKLQQSQQTSIEATDAFQRPHVPPVIFPTPRRGVSQTVPGIGAPGSPSSYRRHSVQPSPRLNTRALVENGNVEQNPNSELDRRVETTWTPILAAFAIILARFLLESIAT